jgi:pSer/pThr/pTyr-binding forkhead associated (FHA) protein
VIFKPVPTPIASSAAVKGAAPAPAAAASGRACPSCGTMVPNEFAFCGTCGNRLGPVGAPSAQPAATMFMHSVSPPAAAVKPKGKMVLIRPDGSEGDVFPLNEGENMVGRTAGPLFENDGYLSPRHAQIVLNAAGCVVIDTGSLNGVYVKMTKEESLESGDIFRVGQELLRFDLLPPPAPLEDGTEIMGSPNPGYWGRLSLVIGRNIDGNAWPLLGDGISLGRERGDINFPDDGYVSGLHARLAMTNGRVTLLDMNSSNGTFLRIRNQRQIETGTLVQFGQQLFRVSLG